MEKMDQAPVTEQLIQINLSAAARRKVESHQALLRHGR
jgi:hypothetical protein